MDSRLVFLVAFVIASAVPYVKADGNFTVLTYNFNRNDCGKTKLCVEKPAGCDPSNASECYFTSTRINPANTSLSVELSGNSSGYITVMAGNNKTMSQGSNVVFVCGNNNGTFFFQTATFKNNTLLQTTSPNVSDIQYSLKPQSLIQCAFNIPIDSNNTEVLTALGLNYTTFNISNLANETIKVFLEVYQGLTNGTVLGQPNSAFGSSVEVDLVKVNSSTVNVSSATPPTTIKATTTTTKATTKATTSGSTSFFNLMNHAALALLAGIALGLL